MNQHIYKVVVPFSHIANDSLSHSQGCMLPKQLKLGGIQIIKQTQHTYIAELDIENSTPDKAVSQAVMLLENLIYLFAIGNHAFRIDFGSLVSYKEADGKKLDFSITDNSFKLKQFYIKNSFRPTPHITFTQILEDFAFEENALSWANDWPDWLKIAMELNYLAVLSKSIKTALVNFCSAIEVLTDKINNIKTRTVLNEHFKKYKDAKRSFLTDFEKLAKKYAIESEKFIRLQSRLQDCLTENNNNRILTTLKKCHVEANSEEIEMVMKQRGSIVHSGEASNHDKFIMAESFARKWVQNAIRNLIVSRLEVIQS